MIFTYLDGGAMPMPKIKGRINVILDIIFITLLLVLFFLFGGEEYFYEQIEKYHLKKFVPLVFIVLISFLYYSLRRWQEASLAAASVENRIAKDSLTKLYNRRAFELKLLEEWQRFERYKEPFSLIMIHIDDLKSINDHFNHREGDRVIIDISDRLIKSTRKTDFCARWSGNEFIVLCPVSKLEPITALAERLRADTYRLLKDGVELSISLGVTQVNDHKSIEAILKGVEFQLYKAKKVGGNVVSSG